VIVAKATSSTYTLETSCMCSASLGSLPANASLERVPNADRKSTAGGVNAQLVVRVATKKPGISLRLAFLVALRFVALARLLVAIFKGLDM